MGKPVDPVRESPRPGLISSTEELRAKATLWDDLWHRSETAVPSARAYPVALWVDHFMPGATFRAPTIERDGQLVAALPLMGRRRSLMMRPGRLPCNVWAASGDLLLDPDTDRDHVLDLLVPEIARLPWPWLVLERVPYQAPRWRALLDALRRAGLAPAVLPQHDTGQVEISHDWQAYYDQRKGRHRQRHRRRSRMLEQAGAVTLNVYTVFSEDALDDVLRRGFEIEDRGWKSRGGTSVLRVPGMYDFFLNEAHELSALGHLECIFLELDQRPIAFLYGWRSKDVHYCVKIAYDESYARFGPGQQLTSRWLERLHEDRDSRLFDFYGPLREWSGVWATRRYPVGRIVVTRPGSPVGKIGSGLYVKVRPWAGALLRRLRLATAG